MKKLTLTFFVAFIAILSSCKKDGTTNPNNTTTVNPEACFNLSATTIGIGEYFTCTSCSKNAETIEWTINNVQVSSGTDLNFSLDSTGTYTIKLTAISKDGKTNNITKTITVINQFTKYAGTWNITETERRSSPNIYNYQSVATVDNKGNIKFSKYSEFEVPAQLQYEKNNNNYHTLNNYIVDITDNYKINSDIFFSENGTQKQFTGIIEYYQGSNYLGSSDVSGVKL